MMTEWKLLSLPMSVPDHMLVLRTKENVIDLTPGLQLFSSSVFKNLGAVDTPDNPLELHKSKHNDYDGIQDLKLNPLCLTGI